MKHSDGNDVCLPVRENRLTPVSADGVYIRVGELMYRHRQDAAVTAVRCAMLFAGALLLRPSFASAAEPLALKLAQTIPLPHVKGGFDLMAADVAGQRLFLAAQDNDTLEVFDLAAGKHLRSVAGFKEPKWVVYRPEAKRLYVSNGGDGSVRVLDSQTFAPAKRFDFREKANNLRYDAAAALLFVGVGKTFGEIAVVDAAKDAVVGSIALAGFPKQFEVDGDLIYVNVPKANHVAVLDRQSMKQIAAWPVAAAKENVPMGFDRTHRRLFIGCEPGKLAVLDTASGAAVAALDISAEPDSIYYDAPRRLVYISCGAGTIDVVRQLDADRYEFASRIPTAPGAATALFVPELKRYCLAVPQTDKQAAELRVYTSNDE